MKTFILTFTYVSLALLSPAVPLDPGLIQEPKVPTKAPFYTCLYNVGPNANLSKSGVLAACLTYHSKVQAHINNFYKSKKSSK